jgi:copper oxidase (laccase) domain-containing protein
VIAGVAAAAVQAMAAAHGTRPADLRAAMGPSIGPCCFEVGAEVAAAFLARRPPGGGDGVVQPHAGARPHIDLRRALALELAELGVPAGQIDAGGECTRCDPQGRFYSYRRDDGRTGQHLGVIVRR